MQQTYNITDSLSLGKLNQKKNIFNFLSYFFVFQITR